MKALTSINSPAFIRKFMLFVVTLFTSMISFAQEGTKDVDVDISTDSGGTFWTSPWVWVIGAAIFILLLVALLRGGGRRAD